MREKFFKEIKDFKGLNVSKSKVDIADNEFSYVLNAIFDKGIMKKRPGLTVDLFRDGWTNKYGGFDGWGSLIDIYEYDNYLLANGNGNIKVFKRRDESYIYWGNAMLGTLCLGFCFMDNNKSLYTPRIIPNMDVVGRVYFDNIEEIFKFESIPLTGQTGWFSYLTTVVRRLFYGKDDSAINEWNKNKISFSRVVENAVFEPEHFRIIHPAVFQKSLDKIQGIVGIENKCIIFQEDGVHVLNCEGEPVDWVLKPIVTNYGLIRPYCFTVIEGNLIFLSHHGLKIFNGAEIIDFPNFPIQLFTDMSTEYGKGTKSGFFDLTLQSLGISPSCLNKFLSFDISEQKLYLPLDIFVEGDKTHTRYCLIYDFNDNYWTVYYNEGGFGKHIRVRLGKGGDLFTHDTDVISATGDAHIKRYSQEKLSDERVDDLDHERLKKYSIPFHVKSKRFTLDTLQFEKQLQRIFLTTNCNAGTLIMKVIVTDVDNIQNEQIFNISTQTSLTTSTMVHEVLLDEMMQGRTIEFEFTNNAIDENPELHLLVMEGEMEYYPKK